MMNPNDSSSNYSTNQDPQGTKGSSAILKQILDGLPRLACVIVAVWDYFHNRDIQRFVLLLTLGSAANWSLPKLKALAPRAGTLARAIAAWLDKVKP